MFTLMSLAASMPQYRGTSLINTLSLKKIQINLAKYFSGHLALVYNKRYLCLFDAVNLPTSESLLSRIEAAIALNHDSTIPPILIFISGASIVNAFFIIEGDNLYLLVVCDKGILTLLMWSYESLHWIKLNEIYLKFPYFTPLLHCKFIYNISHDSIPSIEGSFYFIDSNDKFFISTIFIQKHLHGYYKFSSSVPIYLLQNCHNLLTLDALFLLIHSGDLIFSLDAASRDFHAHDLVFELFFEPINGPIYLLNLAEKSELFMWNYSRKFHKLISLPILNHQDVSSFAVVSSSILVNIIGSILVYNLSDGKLLRAIDTKYKVTSMFPIGFGLIGIIDNFAISVLSPDSIRNQFSFTNHKLSSYDLIKCNWGPSSLSLSLFQLLSKREPIPVVTSTHSVFNFILPYLNGDYRKSLDFNMLIFKLLNSRSEFLFHCFNSLNTSILPLVSKLYELESDLFEKCNNLNIPFSKDFIPILSRKHSLSYLPQDLILNPPPTYFIREPVENMWFNTAISIIDSLNLLNQDRTYDSLTSLNLLSSFVGIPLLNITDFTKPDDFLLKINKIWSLEKFLSVRSSIFIVTDSSLLESSPYLVKLIILYYEHYPIALPMLLSVFSHILIINQTSKITSFGNCNSDFSNQIINVETEPLIFRVPFYLSLLSTNFQNLIHEKFTSFHLPFYFKANSNRIFNVAKLAYDSLQQKYKLAEVPNEFQLDSFVWILVACNNFREALELRLSVGGSNQELASLELVYLASPKSLQNELFVKFTRYILESHVLNEIHMENRRNILFSSKFKKSAPSNFSSIFYVQSLQRELSISSEILLNDRSQLISYFLMAMLN